MEERSHLAIGEVLTLLREEFPDVTISKIRFLESQGLVDPERTPSGYRKFYEADVARLRWILLQQKENFLPLKVIKDRLSELDAAGEADFAAVGPAGVAAAGGEPTSDEGSLGLEATAPAANGSSGAAAGEGDEGAALAGAPSGAAQASGPARSSGASPGPRGADPAAGTTSPAPRDRMPSGAAGTGPNFARRPAPGPTGAFGLARPGRFEMRPTERAAAGEGTPPDAVAGTGSASTAAANRGSSNTGSSNTGGPPAGGSRPKAPSAGRPGGAARDRGAGFRAAAPPEETPGPEDPQGPEGETLTLVELAAAAGLDVAAVQQLQQFGLVVPIDVVSGTTYFDGLALQVARTAAAFGRHGLEARHLRAWRTSAEREATTFEQVIMPLIRQRNPHARVQADETLDELVGLGAELRAALLRQALRSLR